MEQSTAVGVPSQAIAETEIANYRLIEQIAFDELAVTYRASHVTLDRPVLLSLLRRHDWISASRFQLAGRLAARLSHANLLPVIDAGHDEQYGDYLVTPQLDAQPLSELMRGKPFEPGMAVRIVTRLAAVLDYLHGRQVIHRDLQPANILLTGKGTVFVTNLSLASCPETPDLSQLEDGDFLSVYAAPELRVSRPEALPVQDVYSLGAIAYQLLTGRQPPLGSAEWQSLGRRDAALAAADRVVQRMMAEKPADRFASAGAAAAALRQVLRVHLDISGSDLEESAWESVAEWVENPLETVLADVLDERFQTFVRAARRRADELHRRDRLRALLNRWGRQSFFHRSQLGQIIEPTQIVSYNVYTYTLRTLYEQRSQLPARLSAGADAAPQQAPRAADIWQVPVPVDEPFADVAAREVMVPGSLRRVSCRECQAATTISCRSCNGSGRSISRKGEERRCSRCNGSGELPCPACNGNGTVSEEQLFRFTRRVETLQAGDDLSDLPRAVVQRLMTEVYREPIDLYESRWQSVEPIADLLKRAIAAAGNDTRLMRAELLISGTTLTEVDYQLENRAHRLQFVGDENLLVGGWALYNMERLTLVIVVLAVAVPLLIWLVVSALA
jgi:eukaryotic-like serine/threonine-protein kinase